MWRKRVTLAHFLNSRPHEVVPSNKKDMGTPDNEQKYHTPHLT